MSSPSKGSPKHGVAEERHPPEREHAQIEGSAAHPGGQGQRRGIGSRNVQKVNSVQLYINLHVI